MLRTAVIVLCLSVCGFGCDRSPDPPDQIRSVKKDNEGNSWRGLIQALDVAPTNEAKVRLLETFIAANPEHPDRIEAERRLTEIREDPTAKAKKAVAEVAQKALEEGDPASMLALIATESVRQASDRLHRDELSAPITVATADGYIDVKKSLFVHPLVLRGYVRRAIKTFATDKIDKRCDRQCINEAISGMLAGAIGGSLYLEDGKLNPDAVGPLLEKSWVDPDTDVLGVSARSWYAIFGPTIRAYFAVQRAMTGSDPKAGAAALAKLSHAAEISAFYTMWTDREEIDKQTGLSPSDARAVAGWWLRRHVDGTAPLFEAQLMRAVEAFEPELLSK